MKFRRPTVALVASALILFASVAQASGSFRLKSGKVIYAAQVWSYVLEANMGGKHYVTLRFDGSKVQSVESKQAL